MKSNKARKFFPVTAFPDPLASDEVKASDDYGLAMGQKILHEWYYVQEHGSGSACSYIEKRNKYHKLRLYARGEQDTKIYKDLLGGDEATYVNYDWRPIQILPKFVKLIVNQMSERLFNIKAEATDKFSTDLKDTHKRNLEDLIMAKPIMKEAKDVMGVDLMPESVEEYPDTQEEIDLFMKLKYKPAIEIAAEEAIKYTLELNDYPETQSKVLEDVVTLGLGAIKHETHPTKGIIVKYIDPANLVYSYPVHRNFKDVHYYGEVERMTLHDVQVLTGDKFSKEELRNIAASTSEWSRFHGNTQDQYQYRENDLENLMVDVLHFNFRSTNTLTHKKKYQANGGFKMTKKNSTFNKPDKNYKGYDVVKKQIDVWYQGSLIIGGKKVFNYGLCENMIRPEGLLNKTSPNYILYAPDLYQNRTRSLVESVIPYIDQVQQIHIKLQQLIAKARPNGIFIDVDGLNEIDLGGGNFLTPMEVIKIYDETGNVLGTSTSAEGDFSYGGREPIRELKNGVIDGLDRLINAYNHYINLIRDAIGIAAGADATMPHPDTLVGVQQQVALNSNTATRHILDSILNMTERLGEGLSLRIKDVFKYSDLKEVYINAIGKINVKILKALEDYHLHDLGINIMLKPDIQETQYLESNIAQALQQQIITLDDAIDIRSIPNIKLANELLKTRRVRREKEKKQHEMEMEKIRGEAQTQAAQAAAEAKQNEIQAKSQADLQLVQAKAQADMAKIEAEKQAKSQLMEQEFRYNMQISGLEAKTQVGKEKYKEDRKDSRLNKQSSQTAKLNEAKMHNKPAPNFESSEDNISGGIEMGEFEPS